MVALEGSLGATNPAKQGPIGKEIGGGNWQVVPRTTTNRGKSMQVSVMIEETVDEDGVGGLTIVAKDGLVFVEDWEHFMVKVLNAAGYTYVTGVNVITDE